MKKLLIVVALFAASCSKKPAFIESAVDAHLRQKLEDEERAWYANHRGAEVWPGPEKLDPVDDEADGG